MTYDVHAHCVPPALIDFLREEGRAIGIELVSDDRGESAIIAGRVRLPPFRGILSDLDERLAHMDAQGVDVQFLSGWIDLTAYALPSETAVRYSRRFNELLAEEANRAPDRFSTLGTVPLQDPVAAAAELEHAVRELHMSGVQIATKVDRAYLDQADLDPFWEAAASLRCLVVVHPCDPLAGIDLSGNFVENMVGRPAETTIAVSRLLFGGVLERYPDLTMCVVHGGGFLPYQLGRMQHAYAAVPHLAAQNVRTPPEELARQLYYDTVLHDRWALSFLVERIGADRVVLGTDYPFEMGDRRPVETVQTIPALDADQRGLILEGNIERILGQIRR